MRLLVVEDDPDLNRQLATALTDAGYVVDRAFDGEEGHFLGESEPYDAVILDIGLPKMDGISVLEAWRRAGRAMPVLILTARDRWSDKVQGFDAGADDYVAKPFHLEEVLARIRALLRRSAGHAKSELNCGSVRLDTRTGRVTRRRQSGQAHLARIPAAVLPHAPYRPRGLAHANWSSISTTRISTATPTPSRCSSAASARSSASTSSRPCAGSAICSRRRAMRLNSLALRLFFSATTWTVVILVVTGIVLSSLYRAAVERAFDRRLGVYLRTLVADVATPEENAGKFPQSHRRAAVRSAALRLVLAGDAARRADARRALVPLACGMRTLPHLADLDPSSAAGGARQGYAEGPEGQQLRIVERTIDLGEEGRYLVAVAGDAAEIDEETRSFDGALLITFGVLAIVLLLITTFQVRFGLAPLKRISEGLAAIRSGAAERLEGAFPVEIAPLARETNALIDANREIVDARAHPCRQPRACAQDADLGDAERGHHCTAPTRSP